VLCYGWINFVSNRYIKDRGKGIASESSGSIHEFTKWTAEMDFCLLYAMIDKAHLANRVDGSWTTQAYNNIVTALRQLWWVGITKSNIKNRQKDFERHMARRPRSL